jgi:hypothetical protein
VKCYFYDRFLSKYRIEKATLVVAFFIYIKIMKIPLQGYGAE